MKTPKFIWAIPIFFPALIFSQSQDFWIPVAQKMQQEEMLESHAEISEYDTYALNVPGFQEYLSKATYQDINSASPILLDIPDGNGNMKSFSLFKNTTMSPGLAKKFPSISTYSGITEDKKNSIQLTLTNQGVFGMILGEGGSVFINPMNKSRTIYQVFKKENAIKSTAFMQCLFENPDNPLPQPKVETNMANDGKLRTYDLAVATTGEYSQFHIGLAGVGGGTLAQKNNAVMAAIVVTMNRVNGVFKRDVGLVMQLIPNNDLIIFLNGATDPFSNNNAGSVLNQSQTVIDTEIGFSNYDIGHTFTTASGGVAMLASPCTTIKAMGTTGISSPIGDAFDIDYVAHEMGHQFGANHTQNNFCNRWNNTAVEPGSASTIMGYAGICSPNVQNFSDDYFHGISIGEINLNIQFGASSNCPTETNIANTAPVIQQALPNYTIPFGTAFVLGTTATDAEADALTYCWEQMDSQSASMPPSPFSNNGPLFRSLLPKSEPERYFPDFAEILQGNLTPMWEVVPNVARTMNFTLTVRDNNMLGGQTATEEVMITVANTGPFKITSQNATNIQYDQNESLQVTWDVAGTTGNGINATNVDILLSYSGGTGGSFPVILAQNTPNDGSHTVTTPIGTSSSNCRLMVRASDNIFFDVNDETFEITDVIASVDDFSGRSNFSISPNPNNGQFTISYGSMGNKVAVKVFDLRGRLVGSYNFEGGGMEKTITLNKPRTGIYLVQVSDGNRVSTEKLIVK